MTLTLFAVFALCILLGVPVVFGLGIASLSAIIYQGLPLLALPQRVIPAVSDNFSIVAIPLFILAGNIVGRGGMGDRMIKLANVFVGRSRGGLSSTNIVASMFFGGISGSATADTSAIGSILIPAMVKRGYDKSFATAVTVVSSPLGTIIPPSIIVIVYCWVTEVSVGAMFAAGYLPGLLIGVALIITGWIISVRRGYPVSDAVSVREAAKIVLDAVPGLMTVVIIIGGVVAGVFTATEAGSIAVVYGTFVSMFVHKELKLSDFPAILRDSVLLTGVVALILAFAGAFGWLIAFDRVPYAAAELLGGLSPAVFLPGYMILLLILGTFLAPTEALIIVTPILFPVALTLGMDPLHFGMVTITCLALGHISPPVGLCLFVGSAVSGLPVKDIVKALMPFYITSAVAVLLIAYIPVISTAIPRAFGF
ncbi:MAG: C4-dicarboxylate ABC transporter permease [Rhizobiales bacterium]|nr:C4-dicarboxylate ABC transporter permease [Hyphomicrobiales bacterium]|tara:strand:- start:814 stop:2085 length:1272 start_codon:yes stop_codon:yes gene_type:complete